MILKEKNCQQSQSGQSICILSLDKQEAHLDWKIQDLRTHFISCG